MKRGAQMGRGPMGRRPMGGPMAMMKGDKAKDFKGTIRKLLNYMGKYKIAVIIVFIFAIASTAATIFGPKILGMATTKLFEGLIAQYSGTGSIDFGYIGFIILITIGLYVLSAVFAFIQGWIMAKVAADTSYRFRKDISKKINKLPLKYFDKKTHGEVLAYVTNDVDVINQNLSMSLTQIITSVVTIIGVLIMMLTISWILTLVSMIIIPISLVTMGVIAKKSQKHFVNQQIYLGHVNGHVEEMFSGHVVMKAFNGEEKSIKKFSNYNKTLYKSAWKASFITGLMMPLMMLIGNLGYIVIAILGSFLVIQNSISIGDIQAFIQYIRSFTQPLTQIANMSNTLQQTMAAAERIFKFLEEEEQITETPTPITLEEGNKYGVEFKNISFGYDPEKVVIHDFSAIIEPGKKIAIVGPTGAGKTTIVKLLMRFYDVLDGEILVNGHDVREFTRKDLRHLFGMVLQDTWLFNGTIMENIRYGRADATDEEVIEAAKAAHVDHFVHTLPNGYNMVINEEISNISQGQMQLLTIARAVLADPKILILDEATSSVDTRTEILIQQAMDKLMANRTSFIIAHRLSTIHDADLILVMNEGNIVEQGTHDELISRNGFYAEIYNSQFKTIEA
ncbi:MAG: ABC transporter ATP-binding protein [Candidatus Lokiarchaeota archaeon]|nr:ABC transporter ATP-binding protein [Candidatus Lokiarchaeota archaeon]